MKKVREGYKMTELGEIPECWDIEKMEDIISCTQLGTNTLGKDDVSNGIPMLKMGNLTIGGFNFNKIEYIENEELDTNKEFILNKGDFLFNTRNTLELVGKSATWNNQLPMAIFNSNIMRIKYKSNIDNFYMSYYFADSEGWKHLKAIATGTTSVAAIYTKDLMKVKVKLPTLKEQQKISLILSSVDEQIEITDNLIEKTKELKKGLMQKLLTKGIGHSRFKDTEIGRIPEDWEVYRLNELGESYTGLSGKNKDDFGMGKPYIPYKNIFANTKVDKSYLEYVNVNSDEKQNLVCYGDIFFTTSSETPEEVGMSSVLLDKIDGEMYLNSFCFGYRLSNFNVLCPDFARYLLRSDNVRKVMGRLAQGSTRFNLSKSAVLEIKIPLPNLQEQYKIASILFSVDEQIEQYESKKEKLQKLKKGLMQKLLTGKIRVKV